jgi:adenosylmethionine-8-amino-7-oxononanoate aminotransferase
MGRVNSLRRLTHVASLSGSNWRRVRSPIAGGTRSRSPVGPRGAIIGSLGYVIVLMPPLAIDGADLQRLVVITAAAISEVTSARLRAAA